MFMKAKLHSGQSYDHQEVLSSMHYHKRIFNKEFNTKDSGQT